MPAPAADAAVAAACVAEADRLRAKVREQEQAAEDAAAAAAAAEKEALSQAGCDIHARSWDGRNGADRCVHSSGTMLQRRARGCMRIFVGTLMGKTFVLEVDESDTVGDVMAQLMHRGCPPPANARMLFCGRQLKDGSTLRAFGVREGAVLNTVLSLRGGGPKKGPKRRGARSPGRQQEQGQSSRSDAQERPLDPDSADELVPDPWWHDLQAPPSVRHYSEFNMRTPFFSEMMANRAAWAADIGHSTASAIARTVANVINPRIMDMEEWRKHAVDFFKRLCAHREWLNGKWNGRLASLFRREVDLEAQLAVMRPQLSRLESRVEALESCLRAVMVQPSAANAAAVSRVDSSASAGGMRCTPDPGGSLDDHPSQAGGLRDTLLQGMPRTACLDQADSLTTARARAPSVPERILHAQLSAVAQRSVSPGPDALRVLGAHWERHQSRPCSVPTPPLRQRGRSPPPEQRGEPRRFNAAAPAFRPEVCSTVGDITS